MLSSVFVTVAMIALSHVANGSGPVKPRMREGSQMLNLEPELYPLPLARFVPLLSKHFASDRASRIHRQVAAVHRNQRACDPGGGVGSQKHSAVVPPGGQRPLRGRLRSLLHHLLHSI